MLLSWLCVCARLMAITLNKSLVWCMKFARMCATKFSWRWRFFPHRHVSSCCYYCYYWHEFYCCYCRRRRFEKNRGGFKYETLCLGIKRIFPMDFKLIMSSTDLFSISLLTHALPLQFGLPAVACTMSEIIHFVSHSKHKQ